MMISGGENVMPVEIESVLSLHPGVAEVAVAGLPDERLGQRITAFVTRRAGGGRRRARRLLQDIRARRLQAPPGVRVRALDPEVAGGEDPAAPADRRGVRGGVAPAERNGTPSRECAYPNDAYRVTLGAVHSTRRLGKDSP